MCWESNHEALGLFNDFVNIWRRGIPWNQKKPQRDSAKGGRIIQRVCNISALNREGKGRGINILN